MKGPWDYSHSTYYAPTESRAVRYFGSKRGLKAALVLNNLQVQLARLAWGGRAALARVPPRTLGPRPLPASAAQGVPAEAPDLRRGAGGAGAEASGLRQRLGEDGDRLPADPVAAAPETRPEGAEAAGEGVWGPATHHGPRTSPALLPRGGWTSRKESRPWSGTGSEGWSPRPPAV